MKPTLRLWLSLALMVLLPQIFHAQSTSWTGTVSTSWGTAGNWTNGLPSTTLDAVIGDASFTGINQPTINVTASCKSLIVGGTVPVTLTATKNLSAAANITINSNGTIIHPASSISLTGNWINNGTYTTTTITSAVIFSGVAQTLSGTSSTVFRKLTINAGSVLTLATNLNCTGASSLLSLSGTLNPNEAPSYSATVDSLVVNNAGYLKVNAATFAANYILTKPATLSAGSIVDYSATVINQVVSNDLTYSTLRILGAGIKSLGADLPPLRSSSSSVGNLYVMAGTLDLGAYSVNRGSTVTGGTLSISNGASLKIGGTNGFPLNYSSITLNLTSTVEYNGADQAIAAKTYGSLSLSGSTGAVTKTPTATAFTVAGNLTSTLGSASSVSFTAGAAITVTGSVNIGAGTTINGGAFTHTISGSWVSNGTYQPATSTILLKGASTSITGTATQNFYNLSITGSNVTAPGISDLNIAGNLATSGSGTFVHASPGNVSMTGTTKTISGTGIVLNNLLIPGVVTTASTFTLTGNLSVSGSLIASSGIVTMSGSGKSISNTGTLTLRGLISSGTITTSSNFNIATSINNTGTFTATAGTVTFTASSLLSGTVDFFNVTVSAGTLTLAANSNMEVASAFVLTGSLNVTSYVPNTITYNGPGAQTVKNTTYNNLVFANGGTKTAATAGVIVNNTLTIAPTVTFDAATFTHTVLGNWVNNGTFTPGTSTVAFTGTINTTITGATTFNNITVNKSLATYTVTLASNVNVATIAMTQGLVNTGANTLTITTTRSGNAIILGTITRTHAFPAGAYAFEGPFNVITFAAGVAGVTSVTVNVAVAPITDFPYNGAINRTYNVTIPSGTYTATMRLHYEDAELNGNDESVMQIWKYNGTAWAASGKNGNSTTSNYVDRSGLTNLNGRWSMTDDGSVLSWNGSVSSDWSNGSNWTLVQGTPSGAPTGTDIAQIGTTTFVNQPVISTAATVKSLSFGSVQSVNLSLIAGGSLASNGSISGTWAASASHIINVNAQTVTVNGDITLSDNTAGHDISLVASTGVINVSGSVTQSAGAMINFTGSAALNIGKDYVYTSGSFVPGTSTVKYNGTASQVVASVPYYNLTITKTAATIATLSGTTAITGSLSLTSGELDLAGSLSVTGGVGIGSGSTLDAGSSTISLAGNWSKNSGAIFNAGSSTVNFTGGANQSISAGKFNMVNINKTLGTVTLLGNDTTNSNLSIISGSLNLATFTFNQSSSGNTFSISDAGTLLVGGASNFPSGFTGYTIGQNSLVHYNGTVAQAVTDVTYGNITFSNGTTNAKTFMGPSSINGNLIINSLATVSGGNFAITLFGNWTNNGGTFNAGTGDLLLNGMSKTLTGNTTFNAVTVNGMYSVVSSDMTFNGEFQVTPAGRYQAGSGVAMVNGDFTNAGFVSSSGTTTFAGTTAQNIRLVNAINSTSTGIVNFNGTISPVFNSTSTPTFATLNINNTAGISPSVNWIALVAFNVGSGASFNGGVYMHTFSGNFANSGTVTSSGTLNFNPSAAASIALSGTTFSSTGKVIIGGSGLLSITGTPTTLQDVVIANTNAAGVTTPSGWTINGKFSINSDAIFNAGPYTYNVGGNIEADGTLAGGASTFNMTSSAGLLSASSSAIFNHFMVTGSVTPQTDFRVAGDFTNNGTYDGGTGVLIMTGPNAASINGSTNPSSIDQLTVEKSAGITVTQNINISNVTFLNVFSGTLFTTTRTITQDPGGGVLIVNNLATLKLGGTNSLPGFSSYGLAINSTVEYAGTTQAIGNAADYGNLLISAAGTKSALIPFVTKGNLIITNGVLSTGTSTVTHAVAGDFIMTGGSLSGTTSTYLLNGTIDQALTPISNPVNIRVNKTAGQVNLGGPLSMSGVLNLTSGKVVLGSNDLTIQPGGSIINGSQASYLVASSTGSVIQQVASAGSKTFPVGSASDFLPSSISLTAGSTTDNFRMRLFGAVYRDGTTGTPVTSGVVNNSWLVSEETVGGSVATISIQWPASLELPGFTRSASRLSHNNGVDGWEIGPSDLVASGSNPYSISRGGFTDFSVFTAGTMIVLPVTWLEVYGQHVGNDNKITWGTANETDNASFVVEASRNGNSFHSIGTVAGAGNSGVEHHYNFIDIKPATGLWYYRIRQIDIDGHSSYSKIISIQAGTEMFTVNSVFPIPAKTQVALDLTAAKAGQVSVSLLNTTGQALKKITAGIVRGTNQVSVSLEALPAGVYYLQVSDGNGSGKIIRIVKD